VIHSRDDQEVGVVHEVISPENQPQLSQTMMGQYWLGKTKPKQVFRLDPKCFQNVATEFKKKEYLTEFSTDNG